MAAGRIVIPPLFPARDRNARLVAGALLGVYTNGTTTKASIYSNEGLTIPLANPVEANSSGHFPAVWAEAGTTASPTLYTVSISGPNGESIANPSTFDNWQPSLDADTAAVALAEAAADAAEADRDAVDDVYADILAIIATGSDAAAIATRAAKAANLSDLADRQAATENLQFKHDVSTSVVSSLHDKIAAGLPLDIRLDFGAVGDGVTDDGPAFQKASDYGQGRPILVPSGYEFAIKTKVVVEPIALTDTDPAPPATPGAFAPGLWLVGDGMAESIIRPMVPNDVAFDLDVTTPDELDPPETYAYRAQQGIRVSNIAFIGDNAVAGASGFKMRNCYQAQFSQCHIRNLTGTAIILVNGDFSDDGWNMVSFEGLWIESCQGWGIDATGSVSRNEGSFTHLKQVFIQGCGKNEYFRITGLSTANPAVVTVSVQQVPTVATVATAHPFVAGDRVKLWGLKSTKTLAADPITTVNGSKTVTIAATAHGLVQGDNVTFAGATAAGGITISGAYQVASVETNTFTVIHSSAATSSATGGGASVTMLAQIPTVNEQTFYVGPTPAATTFTLYSGSGSVRTLSASPFATTSASATVTVTASSHGFSAADRVVFSEAAAVGGLTISGMYSIVATPTADTFTITAASSATSTATGGGSSVRMVKVVSFNGSSIGTFTSPLTAEAINTNPFATTLDSTTVTVTDTAHGAATTDTVTFAGASAVGGITISGEYRIVSVVDANTYTITHTSAATSTVAAGGGASVTATYYKQLGICVPEVSYLEPRSGGMRWKGQLIQLDQCAFTVNQNVAFFVKGQAGLAIGVLTQGVSWENNYRRHVFCSGVTNWRSEGCQFHGNQSYKQWALADFDGTDFTIRGVQWVNTKVRARLGEGYAFRLAGTNAAVNTCRVRTTTWDDFDYTGQRRFLGWPFDQVEQNCVLRNGGVTAVTLGPSSTIGSGNKTPLRLRGPDNAVAGGAASATGEWVDWRLPNTGATLLNSANDDEGAALVANTLYNVYLYDNDGVVTLVASTVNPVIDTTHGYMVKPTDGTKLYVGRVRTETASTDFVQTSTQYFDPIAIPGSQQGVPEWIWWDPTSGGRLQHRTASRPTSTTAGTTTLRPVLEFTATADLANIASLASTTFTITATGAAVRDAVVDVSSSVDNELVLKGRVSATDTITVTAFNPTAGAIDAANATYTAFLVRR